LPPGSNGTPVSSASSIDCGGLLLTLLPRYEASGKTYLTIAIGCTDGRHRSVYVAERLAACLRDTGWQTELAHRDLSPYAADAPNMTGAYAAGVY
jgi:UPF0042 nucleotide-binding protein